MKVFAFILCCCVIQYSSAQTKLSGKIIDSISKQPLSGVNVFLSNTSIGTISDKNGEFVIQHIPKGKFELIVSSLNYETHIIEIQSLNRPSVLEIHMNPISNNLPEVVVEQYEKDGWEKYGNYFKLIFIGSSLLSRECQLLNPDILHFRLNLTTKKLKAFANENLIFENRALGYKINYVLKKFEIDLGNNTFQFVGYPLFEKLLPKNVEEKEKWNANISAVYQGSLMHFMRSLYANQLAEDGFEVRAIKKISEDEKTRVKKIYKRLSDNSKESPSNDSIEYYSKVFKLSSSEDTIVLKKIISRDEYAFPVDSLSESEAVLFEFDGYLHVTYLHKKESTEYARLLKKRPNRDFISSDLNLPNHKGVLVFKNGRFFYGGDIFLSGYWAWSEKLSTMLPSDYWPEEEN